MDELVIEIEDPSGRRVTMTFRSTEPEYDEDAVLDDDTCLPIRLHAEHTL